jgi:hypothetical protein
MRVDHAAAYLSISRSTFLEWVDEGKMPKPTRPSEGITLWDRLALDVAFENLSAAVEDGAGNSFDKVVAAIKG